MISSAAYLPSPALSTVTLMRAEATKTTAKSQDCHWSNWLVSSMLPSESRQIAVREPLESNWLVSSMLPLESRQIAVREPLESNWVMSSMLREGCGGQGGAW